MSKQLITLPADQLLTKFGSGQHKPGSGSAAALLGLIACKLLQTVITLSAGKEQYKGVEQQLTLANQNIIDGFEPVLAKAFQEDAEAFDRVIKARRARNAETDTGKKRALSEQALRELRTATEIVLRIVETCLNLAEKASVVFDLGFQSARGDSGVAMSAALAGASGALSITYLNLTSFRGGEWAIERRQHADALNERVQRLQVELFERISALQVEVVKREG